MSAREKLCVALDFDEGAPARHLAQSLAGRCGWFKIGLELFVREGPDLVAEIAARGRVFLDLKLHDIPNTVAGAARAAARTGASMINVHASGGRAMMIAARDAAAGNAARDAAAGNVARDAAAGNAARDAAAELAGGAGRPLVIAVTVLTSIGVEEMAELPFSGTPSEAALRLAGLAQSAGLDGVVCSAAEVAAIRAAYGPEFRTVVPGIRPAGADVADQRRIATPAAALAAGASILVVGRPITRASDPEAALEAIVAEMEG